jgi:hypothetical protein
LALVLQLSRLVQAIHAPQALLYVAHSLTWGDPTLPFCFLRCLHHIRLLVFQRLLHPHAGMPLLARRGQPPGPRPDMPFPLDQGGELPVEQMQLQQQQIRRDLDIHREAQQLLLQTQLRQLLEQMIKDHPDRLCRKLREGSPVERLLAIQVIARRRLPLEDDLIEVLHDPDKTIRQTARQALIRIARGTDFGPSIGASKRGIDRAVEQWRHWLELQQSVSPPRLAEGVTVAAATKPAQNGPLDTAKLAVDRDSLELQTASSEVTRQSDELVNAADEEQRAVLERLGQTKDIDPTDVLALAIPKLSGDIQHKAREALTRCLMRLPAATLRDKLQDNNLEVRCAAALACGRKIAKELIPDLLQLLDDPELDVILSARVALTELTGEDFGPTRGADHQGRAKSAAAWSQWWKERQAKRK